MALTAALIDNGQHHAVATGSITVGAGFGEVAALGANQLLRLRLPYNPKLYAYPGFENQFYSIARSIDGNVTNIAMDATQFEYDATSAIIRFRVDITAAPAVTDIQLLAYHSVGR